MRSGNKGASPSAEITSTSVSADKQGLDVVILNNLNVVDLTLSLDTSAYGDGDVLAATQELPLVFATAGARTKLDSLTVLDEDDQGIAFDIVIFNANTALGTENSAPNISDANARTILGVVSVAAADFKDLGGARVQTKTNIGLVLQGAADQTSLWIAAISRGTGTYSAAGIRLKFGFAA